MEFFQIGCNRTHSVQSENNVAESILNFLKFSNTSPADPYSRELQWSSQLLTIVFATRTAISVILNSNSNSTFIALNLYLMIDSKTQKAKIRDRNR